MNKFSLFFMTVFLVVSAFLVYFFYFNFQPMQQTMPLFLFGSTVTVPIFYVVVGVYLLSEIGFSFVLFAQLQNANNIKRFNPLQDKRVERMSVDKETAEMRVAVLEEKIKTLEAALEKALKRN